MRLFHFQETHFIFHFQGKLVGLGKLGYGGIKIFRTLWSRGGPKSRV